MSQDGARRRALRALCGASFAACLFAHGEAAAAAQSDDVRAVVTAVVAPVMQRYGIPGLAVGVSMNGRHFVLDYGVASKATGKPVVASTLFEIGSITKTFTASLASYARLTGRLSLSSVASTNLPALRGTSFERVHLINLGTHTAGGLPLQFPDDVRSDDDAIAYYRHWKPSHAAGTYRLYSNPSVMLLGLITAHSLHADFAAAVRRELFAPLGLHETFFRLPPADAPHYAQGYTEAGVPRRMSTGPLAAEAYGIRTTAQDLLRFIDANMDRVALDATLRRAILATHTGYFRLGAMTQDLVWQQYRYPVAPSDLLRGNSDRTMYEENAVVQLDPPSPPQSDVLIEKTGSTSGFAAYVAFVPSRSIGIVLLANRSYPVEARVTAAYRIIRRLKFERSMRHGRLGNASGGVHALTTSVAAGTSGTRRGWAPRQ